MTSAFSARRRADEFEALLDRGPGAHLTDREAARFAELVAVVSELRAMPEVDDVVCLSTPPGFMAVGMHYLDFRQTSDAEVQQILAAAHSAGADGA